MCRVNLSYSQPIRFVSLDSEYVQSDGEVCELRTSSVEPSQRLRFLVPTKTSTAARDENGTGKELTESEQAKG